IQEVEFDLQPSEFGNRCFLDRNWLLRLVTHTLGCCLDKRFRSSNALTISLGSATSDETAGVEEFEFTLATTALARV
nr:hypothetical protein [Tanacetum cinerariifolium]